MGDAVLVTIVSGLGVTSDRDQQGKQQDCAAHHRLFRW